MSLYASYNPAAPGAQPVNMAGSTMMPIGATLQAPLITTKQAGERRHVLENTISVPFYGLGAVNGSYGTAGGVFGAATGATVTREVNHHPIHPPREHINNEGVHTEDATYSLPLNWMPNLYRTSVFPTMSAAEFYRGTPLGYQFGGFGGYPGSFGGYPMFGSYGGYGGFAGYASGMPY